MIEITFKDAFFIKRICKMIRNVASLSHWYFTDSTIIVKSKSDCGNTHILTELSTTHFLNYQCSQPVIHILDNHIFEKCLSFVLDGEIVTIKILNDRPNIIYLVCYSPNINKKKIYKMKSIDNDVLTFMEDQKKIESCIVKLDANKFFLVSQKLSSVGTHVKLFNLDNDLYFKTKNGIYEWKDMFSDCVVKDDNNETENDVSSTCSTSRNLPYSVIVNARSLYLAAKNYNLNNDVELYFSKNKNILHIKHLFKQNMGYIQSSIQCTSVKQ